MLKIIFRFVLMENVKNFVYEGRHEYFNTMIATLVYMGYQVNAGILQVDN